MINVDKSDLKKICLVSGAAVTAVSGVYGYAAPIAAALGLGANYFGEDFSSQKDLKKSFDRAVSNAVAEAKNHLNSSQCKLLDELNVSVDEPDEVANLNGLVKRTEAYITQYFTISEVDEVVKTFDVFFRKHVAQDELLSRWYNVNANVLTLKQLESIDMIIKEGKDLSNRQFENIEKIIKEGNADLKMVSDNTDKIKKSVSGVEKLITELGYMLSFALISLFGFSLSSMIFSGIKVSSKIEEIATSIDSLLVFACYFISFVLLYLCTKKYAFVAESLLSRTDFNGIKRLTESGVNNKYKTRINNLLNGFYLIKGDKETSSENTNGAPEKESTRRYDSILIFPYACISLALYVLLSRSSINVSEIISIIVGGIIGIELRFIVEDYMNKHLNQVYKDSIL